MPPFTGFFLKALAASVLIEVPVVVLLLVVGRAVSLAFYLNVIILRSLCSVSHGIKYSGEWRGGMLQAVGLVLVVGGGPWLCLVW